MAGSTAATLAARQGIQTVLIDRWQTYPECFKAEKIESDQAVLLRKFELMDCVLPHTGSIREILRAQSGRVIRRVATEQYGIFYHDMVNAIRSTLPPAAEFKVGRVQDIQTSSDRQVVTLASGEVYTPRLVALAAGTGTGIGQQLGLKRRMIQKEQSFAAGFNVQRTDGKPFDFDSITYFPEGSESRIAFLTLFWIGSIMRANLFACWSNSEERTRDFVKQPMAEMLRWLPELQNVSGPLEISGKMETGRVDLYQAEDMLRDGLVLIGDAYQSVCPVTGTGLSKVLTDVDVLVHDCLPKWLSSPGMGQHKIAGFYKNSRKQKVDRHSLAGAAYARSMATNESVAWQARRIHRNIDDRISQTLAYFSFNRRATA